MATSFDYTPVAPSSNSRSTQASRAADRRIVQNLLLVWLDQSINEHSHGKCREVIMQLREVLSGIRTFKDANECVHFLSGITEEKVFVISSGSFGRRVVDVIHDMPHVIAMYIFCMDKASNERWANKWPKIKGVFVEIEFVYEAIKQAAEHCDPNWMSMRFVSSDEQCSSRNFHHLDQSFMYTEILKEILLTIDFQQRHIDDFLRYCADQFAGHTIQLQQLNQLKTEYRPERSIWWYTFHSFLYRMLNGALRTMEVELMIKMGFFIRDLHELLTSLHREQYLQGQNVATFTVYRGQAFSQANFDQLRQNIGGMISFNNFLSTSLDRSVALGFCCPTTVGSDLVTVLFVMAIDPSIPSVPFADVRNYSYYRTEKEILFSMHSVFRIGPVQYISADPCRWEVHLTLICNQSDLQLRELTEHIRGETFPDLQGWDRLTELLIKLGQFDVAEQVCLIMLNEAPTDCNRADIHHRLGMIRRNQAKYNAAVESYQTAIQIRRRISPPNSPDLAASYGGLGSVYANLSEYPQALEYYETAHRIFESTRPLKWADLATSFSNMGALFTKTGDYPRALSLLETALEIRIETLPSTHPHLATSYINFGHVHSKMHEYEEALANYHRVRQIRENVLPENHPHLARCYSHLGNVYNCLDRYSEALEFHERALAIYEETGSTDHPDRAFAYNSMGLLYRNMSDYASALQCHETALAIYKKTLPDNHLDVAACNNDIANVKYDVKEYEAALPFHEKALAIYQQKLPRSHPDLLLTYENFGLLYEKMNRYDEAASSYEQILAIQEEINPPNPLDLASSYEKIAFCRKKMARNKEALREYARAIAYYTDAIRVPKQTGVRNHSDAVSSHEIIEFARNETTDYVEVSSYHERLIKSRRERMAANQLNPTAIYEKLAVVHERIGSIYDDSGDVDSAITYYKKAIEKWQQTGYKDHPGLASSYNKIGLLYEKKDDLSNAVSYYVMEIEVLPQTERQNHSRLASSYEKISSLYEKTGDFAEADIYYMKAKEVVQQTEHHSPSDVSAHSGALSSYVPISADQHTLIPNDGGAALRRNTIESLCGKSDDDLETSPSSQRERSLKENTSPLDRSIPGDESPVVVVGTMHRNSGGDPEVCLLVEGATDPEKVPLSESPKKVRNAKKNGWCRKCCCIS